MNRPGLLHALRQIIAGHGGWWDVSFAAEAVPANDNVIARLTSSMLTGIVPRPLALLQQRRPRALPPHSGIGGKLDAYLASIRRPPLISLLLPLYHPISAALLDTLDAVLAQCYPHWEICIAGDSTTLSQAKRIMADGYLHDRRIRWNPGPPSQEHRATLWAAADMAEGKVVATLGYGERLAGHALYEIAAICDQHPDIRAARWLEAESAGSAATYGRSVLISRSSPLPAAVAPLPPSPGLRFWRDGDIALIPAALHRRRSHAADLLRHGPHQP